MHWADFNAPRNLNKYKWEEAFYKPNFRETNKFSKPLTEAAGPPPATSQ